MRDSKRSGLAPATRSRPLRRWPRLRKGQIDRGLREFGRGVLENCDEIIERERVMVGILERGAECGRFVCSRCRRFIFPFSYEVIDFFFIFELPNANMTRAR